MSSDLWYLKYFIRKDILNDMSQTHKLYNCTLKIKSPITNYFLIQHVHNNIIGWHLKSLNMPNISFQFFFVPKFGLPLIDPVWMSFQVFFFGGGRLHKLVPEKVYQINMDMQSLFIRNESRRNAPPLILGEACFLMIISYQPFQVIQAHKVV